MTSTPLAKHALREPVAFGAGGERSASDLLRDAAWVASQLPEAAPGSHVLLAIGKDRYAFCAALLGTWLRGHGASLPPHTGRDAILRIAQRNETAAVLHDTSTEAPLRIDQVLAKTPSDWPLPERALPVLSITQFDDAMQAWPQSSSKLLSEARALIDSLGLAAGLRYASTLPPCNAYGLMFGVLVPCLHGGAFQREISTALGDTAADVLCSVPAHLSKATPRALRGYRQVISSRAPLTAAGVAQTGREIVDLYGTTAFGSLAVRRAPGEPFRPLPGVSVFAQADGRIGFSSEFGRFSPDDPAALSGDGGFTLAASAGESSEVQLEARLVALSGVREVAVVTVPGATDRAPELLAAVVADASEATLSAALGTSEPLPKRILRVERLQRDDCGRHARARLLALFGRGPDGRPLNFTLDWGSELASREAERERRSYRAHVPHDYGYFTGHFPGYPILPGAAQLSDLVLPCVRRARPSLGALTGMTRVKFLDRIRPDDDVEVELSWREGEPNVEFALRRAGTLCSTGRLGFAAAADVPVSQ